MLSLKFPEAAAISLSNVSTIGRSKDSDIVLDLPAISRNHARIFQRDGRFWVQDISRAGTFLNGVRITDEAPLAARDTIHFNCSARATVIDPEVLEAPTDPGIVLPERIEQLERSLSVYGERQEAIAIELNKKFHELSERQKRNEESDRQSQCDIKALHEFFKKSGEQSLLNHKAEVVLLWSAVLASLLVFGFSIAAVRERRVRPIESGIALIAENNEAAGAVAFLAFLAIVRNRQVQREQIGSNSERPACENL